MIPYSKYKLFGWSSVYADGIKALSLSAYVDQISFCCCFVSLSSLYYVLPITRFPYMKKRGSHDHRVFIYVRSLILGKLAVVKRRVHTFHLHELVVRSLLHKVAILQHQYQVGIEYGGQAMRYLEICAPLSKLFHCIHH